MITIFCTTISLTLEKSIIVEVTQELSPIIYRLLKRKIIRTIISTGKIQEFSKKKLILKLQFLDVTFNAVVKNYRRTNK